MIFAKTAAADLDTSGTASAAARARAARTAAATVAGSTAARVQSVAQNAAQLASAKAQTAAAGANKNARQGVHRARRWAAPQLESAADYFTTTAAPKVSSALRSTARQVRPADVTAKRKLPAALGWGLLGTAILAGAAAVAAIVHSRYRAAMKHDAEPADDVPDPVSGPDAAGEAGAASRPSAPAAGVPGREAPKDTGTSVNGRVSANGW